MEVVNYLHFILIGLILLSGIAFIICILRCNDTINYDKIIADLNKEKAQNLETLAKGNKEIDAIERKIATIKKRLKVK